MAKQPARLERLATELKILSETLAGEQSSDLPVRRAKRVHATISEAYEKLREIIDDLDPVKQPGFVFDPANPNIVGRLIGITMVAQPRRPLANIQRFYGSGVYAIYYDGDFAAYAPLSKREHPLYVGKADPADSAAKTAVQQGLTLYNRLKDHRRSIAKAASTLSLEDFEYRFLVVQSGYQNSAEGYLIDLFKPIWNNEVNICFGIGKHGDAPTTRANLRSPWDTIHPGRDWAHRDPTMKDARRRERILEEIEKHLSANPPLESTDEIVRRFIDEIPRNS